MTALAHQLDPTPPASPIIKYAGGKTKLLPELLARMPRSFGRYYEPFFGGGALSFALQPERAVIGDANGDLMRMYEALAEDVEDVISLLEYMKDDHSEDYYRAMRRRWNSAPFESSAFHAAAFIYLNKTCFNGLWRVNRAGEFNVPIGRYTDPKICEPGKLRAAAAALASATLRCGDYRETVADARSGDFVYFDPPYDGTFTGYTAGTFWTDQQRELAVTARQLVNRGCQVMLSNSNTPLIRELYDGWRIDVVKRQGTMNSDTSKRGKVDEVIITGGYER